MQLDRGERGTGTLEGPHHLRNRGGALIDEQAQCRCVHGLEPFDERLDLELFAGLLGVAGEPNCEDVAGDLALELPGRTLRDDLAVVHDGDPVTQGVGLVQVVGGKEYGHPFRAQPANFVPHVARLCGSSPVGRLVQEDDLG